MADLYSYVALNLSPPFSAVALALAAPTALTSELIEAALALEMASVSSVQETLPVEEEPTPLRSTYDSEFRTVENVSSSLATSKSKRTTAKPREAVESEPQWRNETLLERLFGG